MNRKWVESLVLDDFVIELFIEIWFLLGFEYIIMMLIFFYEGMNEWISCLFNWLVCYYVVECRI